VSHTASVGRLCAGQLASHIASTVRGCGASPSRPRIRAPNRWGPPFKRAPSILAPAPLATRWPLPKEAPPQDHGWQPLQGGPHRFDRRLCAGQLALHMASTVRRCSASAVSPSDSESPPKPLESFKCVTERTGGAASVARCPAPDSLSSRQGTPLGSSTPAIHSRARHSHCTCSLREIPIRRNGVAERFNRTLVELARVMLADAKLPKFLWEPAVARAAYVRNQAYTKAVGATPYECWMGKRPNVAHLREFGAPVWMDRTHA
jgi:hypothetical protein